MQFGHATLNEIAGTLLFMLMLLLFFWFLTSWIPPSRDLRRFVILITFLVVVATVLAEVGMIWLSWIPPWQEIGITTKPASFLDIVALPTLTGLVLGGWFVLSLSGVLPSERRFKFSWGRTTLLILACLLYEIGMLFLGWPAPWQLPIPSE